MKDLDLIYVTARELPLEERPAYLTKACGADKALRARVERLLAVSAEAEAFITDLPDTDLQEPKPGREAAKGLERDHADVPEEVIGQKIGRYKTLERVGEGGCGVVYVAEQTEPVRRRVALKVIKLGMDTKQVVARFEAERQALAMMDHPNIAKVLDGGATDTGRPYFIMELVRGIKITDYCDQASLPTKDRLDLFIQICQAIQHAHQKGIIHRDIKPSNILVTLNDGVPVPKVIDFGIAKATEGKLTDATVYTQLHQFIGTPAYMSPEQAEMTSLDIDTRSDVYSLGVLLYELLSGSTPFDARELMSRGLDAMRKTIREKEPVRPSTRLATLQGDELTTAAKRRAVEGPRLIHLLKGDLDWIVMKCLEKDRTRRYETANGLAADIKRHLSSEPVLARPPSKVYEFQKLVRRNKVGFAATAAVILALSAGVMVSSWQAVLARRERDAKELARQDAEGVSKFLTEVFQSPDPARAGRTITVAETLDKAAKKLEGDPAIPPARRAKLQATLGGTYYALGLYRQAIVLQEKVRDYDLTAFGLENTNTLSAMHGLATSCLAAGRRDEALRMREQVLTLDRKILGPEHPDTLAAMEGLAVSYHTSGRREEALKLNEQLMTLDRKVLGPEHPDTLAAMNNLAAFYFDAGRRDEAIKLQEQVLTLGRKVLGPEHPDRLKAMNNLADFYFDAGRRDEALELQEQVLTLDRKVLGPEHPVTLSAMLHLANSYKRAGRLDEASKLQEQGLALDRKVLGPEHPDTLATINNLATSYFAMGRRDEALRLQEQVLTIDRKVLGPEDPATLTAVLNLANFYDQAGRLDEAVKLCEEVVALDRKVLGPEHPATLTAMGGLANSYFDAGGRDEALKLREQVLTIDRKILGPEHPDTLPAINNLATSYFAAGRRDEALKLREEALKLGLKVNGPEHPNTLNAMESLARSYDAAGRRDEALQMQEQALALRRKVFGPDDPVTLKSMDNLAIYNDGTGHRDEAINLSESALALALKRDPNSKESAEAYAQLALRLDRVGRGDEAIKSFQQAVRIEPDNKYKQYWLGRALVDHRRYKEALPALLAALKLLGPKDGLSKEIDDRLAMVKAMLGGTDGYLISLRQAVTANPTDTMKAQHLANVCLWLGQTNEQNATCRQLLDLCANSKDPTAHDRAAKACLMQSNLDPELLKLAVVSAHQGLALAAANDPLRPWFLITAGLADLRDVKPADAEPLLSEALKHSDNSDQRGLGLAYRAITYASLGRTNEAMADFSALEKLALPLPPHDSVSPALLNVNRLALCIAYEEAKAMLNAPGVPSP